ncbi:MAG: ABC transporter permease, partial [Ferruginibacter sp.]|nr:ABC transporter permease [Cytophagales bacterium]
MEPNLSPPENAKPTPPRWADRLLESFCAPHLREEVQGDLHERFYKRAKIVGEQRARWCYAREVLGFLRPFALKRNSKLYPKTNANAMLRNYLTLARRNLWRNKVYASINVFGLATGIAFCLLIFLFVQDELSFDRFHANADRIYRIHLTDLSEAPYRDDQKMGFFNALKGRQVNKMVSMPLPLGPLLQADIPEVRQSLRYHAGTTVISNGSQAFHEDVQYVDRNFFQLFSFKLKQGARETVLADPSGVVITERIAKKYFGNENPVGKTLRVPQATPPVSRTPITVPEGPKQAGQQVFTITGVAENAPGNSSLPFDILFPFQNDPLYPEYGNELFNAYAVTTFVELRENASPATLRRQLARFVEKRLSKHHSEIRKRKKLAASVPVSEMGITKLTDTHFDATVPWPKVGNPLYAYILSGIAGLILFIACINYVSLALTNAAARTQEIGMRKVMGAGRWQLARQLWAEAQLLVGLAVVVALALANGFLPAFNYFTDKQLDFHLIRQPGLMGALLAIALLVGLLAGSYPAIFLSRFQPVAVLKGNRTYRVSPWLSRGLGLVQYALCLFLVTSAVIMYRQMDFISRQELGFDQQQVVTLSTYASGEDTRIRLLERLRNYVATNPDFLRVSGSNGSIGSASVTYFYRISGADTWVSVFEVDDNYLATLNIPLLRGRNLSASIRSDTNAVLVNETLAAKLGDSLTLGQLSGSLKQTVVGVVKDHHFASLESKIAPMLIRLRPENLSTFLIKIRPGRIPEA